MKISPRDMLTKARRDLLNEAEAQAGMGSWRWIESTDELVWSDGLHKIFNKGQKDIISWSTFLENVLPEDALLVENRLHEVKTERNGFTIDYRITQGGQTHYLSLTVKPHTELEMDIIGTVIDITERKKYEKQLEDLSRRQSKVIKELYEKERKYRSLFERSIDPIFLASDKLMLMDVNESFLILFGYNYPPDTSTITLKDIFERTEDYSHFLNALKETGQIRDFEVALVTKAGESKTCIINCVFIQDQTSEFFCYQGIIHDLSLRKQAETDMILAERLSLTGKIARTIAHEVRNPLTNLNLALDQLRDELPVESEAVNLYCDIIERNANRIEQLVGEMLNSSRPKKLNLRLTEVSELLNDTLAFARDRIQLNDISLEAHYHDDLPRILVDKDKIQIALLNIIINAIEATEPGTGVIKIDASVSDKILTVVIADNGKGIPAADVVKLFDPFFTGKDSGMGLGLTSSRNIINSHSASIEVKSEINVGTSFYIHFKLAE